MRNKFYWGEIKCEKLNSQKPTGLQMDIPTLWKEHVLPSGHTYFTAENNGHLMLEARPNCIIDFQTDTPTFVHNSLQLFEAFDPTANYTAKCVNNSHKECLLVVKYSGKTKMLEKWRWFRAKKDRSYAIVMDFLIYAQDAAAQDDILHLINSTDYIDEGPQEHCHTPAAWL